MPHNKLIDEKSPYLLQHASNPIEWYPWGEEAFKKAREEGKPIFLSIGYSTCHWCHVMAHESFEDEEVAQYLNEHYVAIKVDREERPDIDSVYMKVCQMMTGQGGWPLTIIMTPEQMPFFAGTYFPRFGRQGIPGIMDLLSQLQAIYHQDKERLSQVENSVRQALQQTVQRQSKEGLSKEVAQQAFRDLQKYYDSVFGGFGTGQKFPQPQNLLFLLHYSQVAQEPAALQMVEHTLTQMTAGGLWDHVGFGFSRYAVDRRWGTPHFEKMLYDNALLLLVFTSCFQLTKKPFYEKNSRQIIRFVEREMTASEGGFYSAIDADSEGEEGKYYVWEYPEIYQILGEELGDLYTETHGIIPRGNFEGKNVIRFPQMDTGELAKEYHLPQKELEERLEKARQLLFTEREKRVRPHTDDKILTSWNSLMIAALAHAGKTFQDSHYLEMAKKAAAFLEEKLFENGRLMARYREGETRFLAYLDDYAFLCWAYLELYEAEANLSFLQKALQLAGEMEKLFWDEKEGGFFFSGKDGEELIAPDKEVAEGAMPSGNSIAAYVYGKLQKLTGETRYSDRLYEMYRLFHEEVVRAPSSAPSLLQSILLMEYPGKEVVVIGSQEDEGRKAFLQKLQTAYLPNTAILVTEDTAKLKGIADFAVEYPQKGSAVTVYICENFVCRQPTVDLEQAAEEILEE